MRVLIGNDGSASADLACDLVASIDWPAGTDLEVVTAYQPNLPAAGWPGAVVDATTVEAMLEVDRDLAEGRAAGAVARLRRPGVNVTWSAPVGRPASEILDRAANSTDLVVVGSRGHGAFAEALLGSVSAELVDHAPCPVLVARTRTIGRVLLAEDGSAGAKAAAALLAWPIFARALVRVVSVAETANRGGAPTPEARVAGDVRRDLVAHGLTASAELATATMGRLKAAGLTVDTEVRHGDPAHELVRAAADWKADVIVIGTRGQSRLQRLFVGSVARKVLHHAPCSVLVDRSAHS